KGEDDYGDPNIVCRDEIDNDEDGVKDGLDRDCAIGAKVIIQSITVQDTKPYENADFEIQCKIAVSGDTATLFKAQPCIIANLSMRTGTESATCEFLTRTLDILRYKCNSGSLNENKIASCRIDTIKCNGDPTATSSDQKANLKQKFINVTNPSLCSKIVDDRLKVINIDLEDREYKVNDKIKPELEVSNLDNEPLDIVSEVYLYDINKKQQLAKASQTKSISQGLDTEEIKLELITPSVSASKHRLYFKTYLRGQESEICLVSSKDIQIKASSNITSAGTDFDKDGYVSNLRGGNDCNDNNPNVNPGAAEICADNLDNNCNNLVDGNDLACAAGLTCTSGEARECGLNVGICKKGTQTCTNDVWGECVGEVKEGQEICDDTLDNDCNGLTDCSDNPCSNSRNCLGAIGDIDSDSDGLLDSWELQYFSSLEAQSGEDDFDNDGYTNAQEYGANTNPTDSSSLPEEKSPLIIIIVVIVLLGITGALVWFFVFKPKKPMPDLTNKPSYTGKSSSMSTVNPILTNYIKTSLKKGYTKQQVRNALILKGWKERDIEEAFKQIR
ncbi:MAG: putative metal-binding motif-containing protein, partial [Nanoarchaeota archaeon]